MPALPFITALIPLITLLIATIARFAIKIFMKVFDWSTDIFFGKISTDQSRKLTILSALSMIWVITLVCLPFPSIAKFTLAFLPTVLRTNKLVVYLLNGSGVLFIPPLVGIICIFWDMQINIKIISAKSIKSLPYKQALLGFYYTFFLGLGFMTMFIFSPIIKLISFIKKRKMIHAPATIQKGRYEIVLRKLQKALKNDCIDVKLVDMGIMNNIPITLVGYLSDSLFKNIIVKNKKILHNKDLEIYIHYEDIMILGKEELVKRSRAIIGEVLMFDTTYLTWDDTTKELEDKLLMIYSDFIISGGTNTDKLLYKLEKIKNIARSITADYDDIETLLYQILVLENMVLKSKIDNKLPKNSGEKKYISV